MAKTALVTGGSSGLGYEIAKLFAKDGYDLVLVARNEDKLKNATQQLENDFGINAHYIALDLSAPGAADALISSFDKLDITIDALVNDAGFGISGTFVKSDWKKQEELLNVNIAVLTKLSHEFGARMAARGSGEILNVASIASYLSGPYMATYYASKAYVRSLTEALHAELKPYGVHVSSLNPGPIKTNFFNNAGFGKKSVFSIADPPAMVAHAAYNALRHNRADCLPGVIAKLANIGIRLVPSFVVRNLIAVMQHPYAKKNDPKE